MLLQFELNGKKVHSKIEDGMMLIDLLRLMGMKSVKCGCDTGNCGLCTVWLDGKSVLSCSIPAARVEGRVVTTLEGVKKEAGEFSNYLAEEGADQCGYCAPGLIMNVLALKREIPNPSGYQIKEYLSGNLCRCTGYEAQFRALKRYFDIP